MKSVVYVWVYTLYCVCVITSAHTRAAAAEVDAVREQQLKWGAVWSDHARPRVPGPRTDTRGTD